MRNTGGNEPAGADLPDKQPAGSSKFSFKNPKIKLPSFRRSLPKVVLTFEENLRQGRLFQAGKQLIQQEEHLFGREIGKEEKESGENKEKLKRDYESLLKKLWQSVDSSLSAGAEELEGLKSAVSCIQQEEEQDRRWGKKPETQAPEWRPRQCRQMHDAQLEKMVEKRMEEPNMIVEGNMSSLKRDICKMGKQMKEDLLKVARELQNCYPEEFDICSVYAGLYHQAFSQRLTEIADYGLVVDDCIYLLTWVNNYYPKTYIVTERDVFTEEMRCCLSLVNAMKDCGYQYLSKIIHEDMKVRYGKLGTQSWLTENSVVMKGLLEGLTGHIEKCSDLKTSCFEEFVGRLHGDVMVEYVYRLLKKKLRLKDQGQQEAAARLLCEDSKALHALFTEKGSKEEWLSDILPKMSEVLKTQDPSMIQLEIITLAWDYPDLSDCHVSDLLHLKMNLPISDIKMIKESLSENRNSVNSQNTRTFFSRVHRQDHASRFSKMMRLPH
ncbi:hypothetical protein COCON_G00015950 [Conger conger]|uniref:Tumor necrosis factor alpha-induced protein 2 n=1 Tax=Conger conger TaxID=82655 RepID=A0A9Q1E3G4_CONCO|nr:hypothetical protein COCON_G00015950 [Conger conger]